uniref:PX domain-containing protein n=1 Tax=Mola mola TaxID=94237 RepID=A0A3Q3XDE8_MOLML
MANPFVPVPACRFWTRRASPIPAASSIKCETLNPDLKCMRGVGPGTTTPDDRRRTRGGVLDGSSTLLESDGSVGHSWEERPTIPTLLGYQILEKRAKLTVYKILVMGGQRDSWVIFRQYSDFCRLKDKLKELFPSFSLALPPKHWFRNSYDEELLEERRIGLQTFLQSLTSDRDVISTCIEAVQRFLCLANQPFDNLEEIRAVCEALEENNHHLQRDLLENQREVDTLKKTLEEKENHINLLLKKYFYPLFKKEKFTHLSLYKISPYIQAATGTPGQLVVIQSTSQICHSFFLSMRSVSSSVGAT